jgi:hypothetical protein
MLHAHLSGGGIKNDFFYPFQQQKIVSRLACLSDCCCMAAAVAASAVAGTATA